MLSESLWIFGVCWEDWWFSGAFCFVFFNYSFFYFHKVWSVYPFIFLPHLCHTPGMFALSPCFVYLSQRYSSSTHKVGVATFFFFSHLQAQSQPTKWWSVLKVEVAVLKWWAPATRARTLIMHHKNNHTVVWMAGCYTTVYYGRCSILFTWRVFKQILVLKLLLNFRY